MKQSKKLIEVALPLDAINKASAKEKSIRHGHPSSSLHLRRTSEPMKTIELASQAPSLPDLLRIAHEEPVLIRTASGEEFVLGAIDDFEREVDLMRASPALKALLEERRKQKGTVSVAELRARLA
jgi:Protein of unknown function (DUF1156)